MNKFFDPNKILPNLAQNEALLIKLTKLFLESIDQQLIDLSNHLDNNDLAALSRLAHSIKPSILILFPKEYHKTILFLEKEVNDNTLDQGKMQLDVLKTVAGKFALEANEFLSQK